MSFHYVPSCKHNNRPRTLLYIADRAVPVNWDSGLEHSWVSHRLTMEPAFKEASRIIGHFSTFDCLRWRFHMVTVYRTLMHCPKTNIAFFETLYTHPSLRNFDLVMCAKRDIPESVISKIGPILEHPTYVPYVSPPPSRRHPPCGKQ